MKSTAEAGVTAKGIDDVSYRLLNGAPNAVVYYATPFAVVADLRPNLGMHGQDQWRLGRAPDAVGLLAVPRISDLSTDSTPQ